MQQVDEEAEASPALLRARLEVGRDLAELVLRATRPESTDEDREELERAQRSATRWERSLLALPPGLVWELTEKNLEHWRRTGQAGQVWIRWDAVAIAHRPIAISMASFLRDLYGGRRPAGHPRGSHLTQAELEAIQQLGDRLRAIPADQGWRHMVASGAWQADGCRDWDQKARRARAARWRRLLGRYDACSRGHGESGGPNTP